MGINGLLRTLHPLLTPPTTTNDTLPLRHNIRQFAHQSLAIDASSWLFKAGHTCAPQLVESIESGIRNPAAEASYSNFMIQRCKELLHLGVTTVVLVFDGTRVPMKRTTNLVRERGRVEHLATARRLVKEGRRMEAEKEYKMCIRSTEEMARVVEERVVKEWEGRRVRCVWSPYEADAQLVKLCLDGVCDAVVTEDSDVLVYSAACGRAFPVIYKWDRKDGSCDVISMDWLLNPNFTPPRPHNSHDKQHGEHLMYAPVHRILPPPPPSTRARRTPSSIHSTLHHFRQMEAVHPGAGARLFVQACVLSGCDYVPNRLSKVGVVTAFRLVRESKERPEEVFGGVLNSLPRGSRLEEEKDNNEEDKENREDGTTRYVELLGQSEAVFYYHLVREASGLMVPLVPHPTTDATSPRHDFVPTLKKFKSISFIGLVDEAKVPTVLPPCPNPVGKRITREKPWTIAKQPQGTGMGGRDNPSLHPSMEATRHQHDFAPTLTKIQSDITFIGSVKEANDRTEPTRTTRENQWITAKQSRVTGMRGRGYLKRGVGISRSTMGSNPVYGKNTLHYSFNRSIPGYGSNHLSSSNRIPHRSDTSILSPVKLPTIAPQRAIPSNRFSSFTFSSTPRRTINLRHDGGSPPKTAPDETSRRKSPFASPLTTPLGTSNNFDYTEGSSLMKHKSNRDPYSTVPPQALEYDDTVNDGRVPQGTTIDPAPLTCNATCDDIHAPSVNDGVFDCEIVPESPSVLSPSESHARHDIPNTRSKHFMRTLDAGSPRRISTSPSDPSKGRCPEDAINLMDDSDDREPPNVSCHSDQVFSRASSSVLKRPFQSPYPNAPHERKRIRPSAGLATRSFKVERRPTDSRPVGTRSIRNYMRLVEPKR